MNYSPAAILYDGYGNPVTVVNGALSIIHLSTTSNISAVEASTNDTLLLGYNLNRRGVFFFNDTSSAVLKLLLGSAPVSITNFSVTIASGGLFEIPFGYIGEIRGIWSISEADGYVRITELI